MAVTTEEGAMYNKKPKEIIAYIGKRMLMLVAKLFSMQTVHTLFITVLCHFNVISAEQWMGIFIVLIVRSGSDRIADKLGISIPDIIAASRTSSYNTRSYEYDTVQNDLTNDRIMSTARSTTSRSRKSTRTEQDIIDTSRQQIRDVLNKRRNRSSD